MSDRRFIDAARGRLSGEGAGQEVDGVHPPGEPEEAWPDVPSSDGDRHADPTYYDRPAIKEPVWIWAVPAYFYAGGTAGAAAALGAAAQATADPELRRLVLRARGLAAAGTAAGTALLIYDLGRPERFLNMLRVFRPTSPMSVGSWLLAAASGASAGAAVLGRARGRARGLGEVAGVAAGVLGLPLAGYTATLVSNTAVPVWSAIRRPLPHLFVSSGTAAAADVLRLAPTTRPEGRVLRRYALLGKVGELVSGEAVERAADRVEQVGRPLHTGVSGAMWKAAKSLTVASLALDALPGERRRVTLASALLGIAGGVASRFAIFQAGKASARDPRATFHQQRDGYGGAEVTGSPARTSPGRSS